MTHRSALWLLHITVVLYGITGILGKLITIPAAELVWYRVGFAALALMVFILWSRQGFTVQRAVWGRLVFVGVLLAAHWIFFFRAIDVSNVTVCLIGVSTFPLFTAVIEPVYFRHPIRPSDIMAGALVLVGIIIIGWDQPFTGEVMSGLLYGAIAALLATLFTVINREMVAGTGSVPLAFWQLLIAFIAISVVYPSFFTNIPSLTALDLAYLLILGLICTALAHVFNILVMTRLTAFTTSVIINLEPLYGIVMAVLIFQEHRDWTLTFWLGGGLLIAVSLIKPMLDKQRG